MKSISIARAIQMKNRKGKEAPVSADAPREGSPAPHRNLMKDSSIVEGIMAKKMAKGGEVESEEIDLEQDPEAISFDQEFADTESTEPAIDKIKARLAAILSK